MRVIIFFIFQTFVCFPVFSHGFNSKLLLQKSIPIVKDHCRRYKIDESHNHIHSVEVANYCLSLIKSEKNLTNTEKKIALLGSIFHDTIDSKYISSTIDKESMLRKLLLQVIEDENNIINDVILFCELMSYSKTVSQNKDGSLVLNVPDKITFHPHNRAYHLMRNADLLSSYNLKRCLLYHCFHEKTKDTTTLFLEMKKLYYRRMYYLRKCQILSLSNSYCDISSKILEDRAEQCIQNYEDFINLHEKNLNFNSFLNFFENKI